MLHLSQNIRFKPCWKQQVNYNFFAQIIGGKISKTPQTMDVRGGGCVVKKVLPAEGAAWHAPNGWQLQYL